MNPITLVAILCLAYSVAGYGYRSRTDGHFEYELFGNYEEKHKKLLQDSLHKNFSNSDLVMDYKVDTIGYDGEVYMTFPAVILRHSKRPIYFMYEMKGPKVERISAMDFMNNLEYNKIPTGSDYYDYSY